MLRVASNKLQYYKKLNELNNVFYREYYIKDKTFSSWLVETYGIQVIYDDSGNITDQYDIVDENKHLLFVMKHSCV